MVNYIWTPVWDHGLEKTHCWKVSCNFIELFSILFVVYLFICHAVDKKIYAMNDCDSRCQMWSHRYVLDASHLDYSVKRCQLFFFYLCFYFIACNCQNNTVESLTDLMCYSLSYHNWNQIIKVWFEFMEANICVDIIYHLLNLSSFVCNTLDILSDNFVEIV